LHGTPRKNKKTTTAQQTKQPGDDKSRKNLGLTTMLHLLSDPAGFSC
jgi:hypothetical protein